MKSRIKNLLLVVVLSLFISSVQPQDDDENKNIWQGENPYMFIYYDLVEYLDDFYDTKQNIKNYYSQLVDSRKVQWRREASRRWRSSLRDLPRQESTTDLDVHRIHQRDAGRYDAVG